MAGGKKPEKQGRKLSIIFAADVAGYSRLMADDEDRTLALLERSRRYIDKNIEAYRGRIANTAGDSIIAVFESATEALECSLKIQQKLKAENARFPKSKRLIFRIGLHMGEIYTRGTDILGDGVNIAARLEGFTQPGAVCMSETFLNIAEKSVSDLPIADVGFPELKNIDTPIHAFEMLSDRAEREGVKFRNQARLSARRRKIILGGSAAAVVVLAMSLAVSIAFSIAHVSEMAQRNKLPDPAGINASETSQK